MTSTGLEAEAIDFAYRAGDPVLRGATCAFPRGELTALVGNNGSGKSTLLKVLVGILRPRAGCVRFDGRPVTPANLARFQQQVGFMPESLTLYPEMRARAALAFLARLKGLPASEVPLALRRVGLDAHGAQRIRTFSKGMRQRLNLAQALLGEPSVVVLDEPSNGFDLEGVSVFYEAVRELLDRGVAVLLSSHLFDEIRGRIDRVALIAEGVIRREGRVEGLLADLGPRRKSVWLKFAKALGEADYAALSEVAPGLQASGDDSLHGELDGPALAAVLSAADARNLALSDIRIEGNELVSLLEASQ